MTHARHRLCSTGLLAFAASFAYISGVHAALFSGSSNAVWPVDSTGAFKILVCSVDDATAAYNQQLETVLTGSWEENSKIDFWGFQNCSTYTQTERDSAIGWKFSDSSTPHAAIGYERCKGKTTATDFCVQTGPSPNTSVCRDRANFDRCFDQYAIHEFGHALGFMHGQQRMDRPCGCKGTTVEPSDATYYPPMGEYGTYDYSSIMTYGGDCIQGDPNSVRFGGSVLSPIDILALQAIYGTPTALTASRDMICHEGLCIPDSDDPRHAKNYADYAISEYPTEGGLGLEHHYVYGAIQTTTTTPRYSIPPAGAVKATLVCNNPDETQNNSKLTVSDWFRDHWTVTCWVEAHASDWTRYRCQNWNTDWGDPHPAWFDLKCQLCQTPEDSASTEGTGLGCGPGV